MAEEKKCEMPNCSADTLIKLELESTWTTEKFYCPKCGRIYFIPTTTGKVAQVAPLALFGGLAMALLTQDWEQALQHASDALDHFSG